MTANSEILASGGDGPLFFEDLRVGESHRSAARTVTEADIVSFAGLSGDYNPLHVDAEFGAASSYGTRVAHGLLVLSLCSGLSTRIPFSEALQPNILGLLDLQCRWPAPTRIGDTLHVELTVTACEPTSREERGVLTMDRLAVIQDGTIVMSSTWKLLISRRATRQQGATR